MALDIYSIHSYQNSDAKSKKEDKKRKYNRNHAIVAEQKTAFLEKMKRRKKKGHKHRNQEEPRNHDGTEPISFH